ncbi:MAG: hypothetical protein Q7S96_04340 [bacterium]|nr:hypothetical protein [bacterium]
MKITVTTSDHAMHFMRRAGYGFQKEGGGEAAFIRRVGASDFPRYHAYVVEAASGARALQVNLHVDQKAPTYGSGKAHSGEYDGPLVAQEADRLRDLAHGREAHGASAEEPKEEKKGFFGKLFG